MGSFSKALGETEARKSDIAHTAIGRIFKHFKYFTFGKKSLSEELAYGVSKKRSCFFLKS